jgi:hypothetical protein
MVKRNTIADDVILKFDRHFEDDYMRETWKYDLGKHKSGPIEVIIHYKPIYIREQKELADMRKLERKRIKKIKKK